MPPEPNESDSHAAAADARAPVLVTGIAGFIGSAVARRLLDDGARVVGIDNLNASYDPALKEARLAQLARHPHADRLHVERGDVAEPGRLRALFEAHRPRVVTHLAAQAGVRASIDAPRGYIDSNVVGFLEVLECCRAHEIDHLVYASSSSVYGAATDLPFRETIPADHPVSLYAATKRANEMMAHVHAHLFGLPSTGLRFFTVYGPWGRPDMALFLFTRRILAGEPIQLFNHGRHRRDFTYVDDIVEGVRRVMDKPPALGSEAISGAPARILNIGCGHPVELTRYVELIEQHLGRRAIVEPLPLQPGDVPDTWADTTALRELTGWTPATSVEVGVERFVRWYLDYFGG